MFPFALVLVFAKFDVVIISYKIKNLNCIYWGFGAAAGELAGRMKQNGQMWVLWPKQAGAPSAR